MTDIRSPTKVPAILDLDRHVERRESVVHKVLDGEAVLLDLAAGSYFGLDPVGTHIWELLDGRALREVRDAILLEFEVDAATAEKDLIRLVGELVQKDLVRLV